MVGGGEGVIKHTASSRVFYFGNEKTRREVAGGGELLLSGGVGTQVVVDLVVVLVSLEP